MPDLGLTRLREQHTRDKAITSICGECGWPFPCATVRLLDRLAALEEAVNTAYAERNLVAQLAAALGYWSGYPAWWGVDPAEPDWPVLYIDFGAYGQVSWHMPRTEVLNGGLPETGPEWDGHSTETKDDRIRRFVTPAALAGTPKP